MSTPRVSIVCEAFSALVKDAETALGLARKAREAAEADAGTSGTALDHRRRVDSQTEECVAALVVQMLSKAQSEAMRAARHLDRVMSKDAAA